LAFGFVIEGTVCFGATFDLILSKNRRGDSDQDVVVPAGNRGARRSGERHVRFDRRGVHFGHKGHFSEIAFPLTVLVLQQVALAFFAAEHFACSSQLEPFGDGFPGFRDACVFGHRGREGRGFSQTCKRFLDGFLEVEVVRVWV
jgi:hypothetical protein